MCLPSCSVFSNRDTLSTLKNEASLLPASNDVLQVLALALALGVLFLVDAVYTRDRERALTLVAAWYRVLARTFIASVSSSG